MNDKKDKDARKIIIMRKAMCKKEKKRIASVKRCQKVWRNYLNEKWNMNLYRNKKTLQEKQLPWTSKQKKNITKAQRDRNKISSILYEIGRRSGRVARSDLLIKKKK